MWIAGQARNDNTLFLEAPWIASPFGFAMTKRQIEMHPFEMHPILIPNFAFRKNKLPLQKMIK
jgi:hypothetical protein